MCDCSHYDVDRNGADPMSADMGGTEIGCLDDVPLGCTCEQVEVVRAEVDATAPAADVIMGAMDEDEMAVCTSCCVGKLAPSAVNKSDNFLDEKISRDPHLSGSGEFRFTLVAYGYGMGDSSDEAAVVSFEQVEEFEHFEDVSCAVTTGCLNAGKLLTINCPVGKNCLTASDAVGIMCDVSDAAAECEGKCH